MTPDLVIFDCDGVLVDTETVAHQRMADAFTEIGFAMSLHECRDLFEGKTLEDLCRHVQDELGRKPDPELTLHVRHQIETAVAEQVTIIPGASELLDAVIARDIPYCVASSGSVRKMHMTLGKTGLLDRLEHVLFSAQDVGRGKPHPDVFLAAAQALGVPCERAVIIEDSVSGIRAGLTAGARVLGYAGDPFTKPETLEAAGAQVFFDMDDAHYMMNLKG